MAIVKLTALTGLKSLIAAAMPGVFKTITIQIEPSPIVEQMPNLEIILPGRMMFEPDQRDLVADLGNNVVVFNVGQWVGPVQLRIVATSPLERWALEDTLTQFLMARPGSPGVVVVAVTESAQLSWAAAFEYEDSQLFDQRAQERQYEVAITCNAEIPVLVTESPVYDIDALILGLTSDFATSFDATTFKTSPQIELVTINQDGSLSPYVP